MRGSSILLVFSVLTCVRRVTFHSMIRHQAGGYCCWLDAGNWWIICRLFLLLETPIEWSIEGFLGVADLPDWVVDVSSSAATRMRVVHLRR